MVRGAREINVAGLYEKGHNWTKLVLRRKEI